MSYTGPITEDVVAVFDSNWNQVFEEARAIKVNVMPTSKLMDHPIETGAMRSDFMIFLPIEIELAVICTGKEFSAVYQQIKTAFLGGDVYTVNTRADVYKNMMIQAMPHDETPDMYDVLAVAIKMRQVIQVETQYQPLPAGSVQNPNDQSTINTGTISPTPAPSSAVSAMQYFGILY